MSVKVSKMMRKIRRFFKGERGNVMVLFAGALVVIIGFVGLSIDIGLLCLQRNTLQNMTQVIRGNRFTYQDTIRYADDPGKTSFEMIQETLAENGFDGTIKVYFYEETPAANYRCYRIRTELSEDFSFYFARIFGLDTTTITVSLDGGESIGDISSDVIWYPQKDTSEYNGSYTGTSSGGYVHDTSDIPPDWLP